MQFWTEIRRRVLTEGLSKRLACRAYGLFGVAGPVQRAAQDMQRQQGVPSELAVNATLAAQVARARGVEFNRRQYLAGLVVGGAGPADLTQPDAIAQTLRTGGQPGAQAALQAYLADAGPATRAASQR